MVRIGWRHTQAHCEHRFQVRQVIAHEGDFIQADLSDKASIDKLVAALPEVRWGTTGAPQVHVGLRQAGRPITLDGRESEAWLPRALCDQIYAWHALPGATFSLLIRGQARNVSFDTSQGAGFTANPIWKLVDGEHTGETLYRPFFKFLEI